MGHYFKNTKIHTVLSCLQQVSRYFKVKLTKKKLFLQQIFCVFFVAISQIFATAESTESLETSSTTQSGIASCAMSDIPSLRATIDSIDDQVEKLLNQRARCAIGIGDAKKSLTNGTGPTIIYRPEREAKILNRLINQNQGPLDNATICKLYREIIFACRNAENELTAATLGPMGTFSEMATRKHFGQDVTINLQPTIGEIFRAVRDSMVEYGVVPFQSLINGYVESTLMEFVTDDSQFFKIISEIYYPIEFTLAANSSNLSSLTTVAAHRQALEQCEQWIKANLAENVELRAVESNGLAGKIAREDGSIGTLISSYGAKVHGLKILARNCEDRPTKTRFVVISRNQTVEPSGIDKTTLIVKNGAKFENWLQNERENGTSKISVTKILDGDTLLCVEIEGHANEEPVRSVIQSLNEAVAGVKMLGSYPAAVDC